MFRFFYRLTVYVGYAVERSIEHRNTNTGFWTNPHVSSHALAYPLWLKPPVVADGMCVKPSDDRIPELNNDNLLDFENNDEFAALSYG